MAQKKSAELPKGRDLAYKVDLIFRYTQDMHRELITILSMVGIVFALLLFNTYTLYNAVMTGAVIADSDFGAFSPFGLAIVMLFLAILFLGLAHFRKGKFKEMFQKL
jgi:hypothetical protein